MSTKDMFIWGALGSVIGSTVGFHGGRNFEAQKHVDNVPEVTVTQSAVEQRNLSAADQCKVDLYQSIQYHCGANITKDGVMRCMSEMARKTQGELPANPEEWTKEQAAPFEYIIRNAKSIYNGETDAPTFVAALDKEVAMIMNAGQSAAKDASFINNGDKLLNQYVRSQKENGK